MSGRLHCPKCFEPDELAAYWISCLACGCRDKPVRLFTESDVRAVLRQLRGAVPGRALPDVDAAAAELGIDLSDGGEEK